LYKQNIQAYATGGYTGEWGSSGKLAILHEKELVLNENDTANLLNAIALMRDISGLIQTLSISFEQDAQLLMSKDKQNTFAEQDEYFRAKENQSFDIQINADFPNATDRNEIQAALENLISLAEQKANER
jgi:hypothetical protein